MQSMTKREKVPNQVLKLKPPSKKRRRQRNLQKHPPLAKETKLLRSQ